MDVSEQNNRLMVRIAGARVKDLREKQGLTQLYMASVVGVTTETISRWENGRYPSIKGDNAEKLAEALGVELAEILEAEMGPEPTPEEPPAGVPDAPPAKPVLPAKIKRHLAVILLVVLVVVALQVARYVSRSSRQAVTVAASRILPPQVPAGQPFPILIKVESSAPVSFALLLKENLPPGCEPLMAVPEFTSIGKDTGQVKWVSRLEGQKQLVAYLVKAPLVPENTEMVFNGRVLAGPMSDSSPNIGGANRLRISSFHWADHNRDNLIDDEEILGAYDLFGKVEGFDFNRDLIDEIWAAGGYQYNRADGRYEILP